MPIKQNNRGDPGFGSPVGCGLARAGSASSTNAADPRRSRVRPRGARRQQRPQARPVHPRRRDRSVTGRDLDRRVRVVGRHRQANGAGPGSSAQPGRLRRCRRLDPIELTGEVPRPAARHQGRHPMASRQCVALQPRWRAHRRHGRQFWRLDDRDGRADRRRAGDGRLGGHDRTVEQSSGSGCVLSAHELPDHGPMGAQKVHAAGVPRRRAVARVSPGRLRHPDVPRQGAGGQSAALRDGGGSPADDPARRIRSTRPAQPG